MPRQSGIVPEIISEIIFEPEYSSPEALRGIEGFSHIWLIWGFSEAKYTEFSPTVRPPRLGGNERLGVFATRSPYRPNSLALSCVKIISVDTEAKKTKIKVAGADLKNGTPIYDIKPYLPYTDSIPDAKSGFAPDSGKVLYVDDGKNKLSVFPPKEREAVIGILSHDPRPQYQKDETRIYGLEYGENDIKFRVAGEVLTVTDVIQSKKER